MGIGMLACAATIGCGSGREAAWNTTPETTTTQNQSAAAATQRSTVIEEGTALWGERIEEAKLVQAIRKWEQAAEMDPSDHEHWVRLARAYYFLADGHMSFDEARKDEMIATFEKGIEAAERALIALSPDFAQRMRAGTRIEEAIAVLDASAVPALYWRSSNMGKWGIAKGFATVLSYKDEIRAVMARCLELDATYFYHGPHRYFGAFYARIPAFAGGDLEKSKQHFDAALAAAPDYLGTRTLYAEFYAVKSQNRQVFDEMLDAVIAADVSTLAEDIRPENTIEQRRAQALKAKADELFE
jgi:tetratricopeptide (TPR) repeat protein